MNDELLLPCNCHSPFHHIRFSRGEKMDGAVLYIHVVNEPLDGWRDRLRAAWAMLRGREHAGYEIIIRADEDDGQAHIRQLQEWLDSHYPRTTVRIVYPPPVSKRVTAAGPKEKP